MIFVIVNHNWRFKLIISMVKVAVIGVGNLGSCIAYEVANRGLTDELVLVDIRRELAGSNFFEFSQLMVIFINSQISSGLQNNFLFVPSIVIKIV